MYAELLWLIVFCGCGIASCVTYIVCLLVGEGRRRKKENKDDKYGSNTLVIDLDE